jgi:hypothetical protein
MVNSPKYTLAEVVEQLLIRKFNQRRKYFGNYFRIAEDVYKDLYRTVLPTVRSKYVQVITKEGEPFPYVEVPAHMVRFFSISVTNKHRQLLEVYYNDELNVFTKPPVVKSCGCTSTDLCDCIDNLQVIITPKVIDGVTYYEKVWIVCCDNGEVKQYSEVPVKKYGDTGGDYGDDYGDDYDIISDGDNVVVLQFYKLLGKLETKDCGCPVESETNRELILNKCGCHLGLRPRYCTQWYDKKNIRCTGEMKFSECGTRIYLVNVCDDDGFVVISYQADEVKCGEEILVDDYAREAIWDGTDEQSIRYHPKSTVVEKEAARQQALRGKSKLFEFLNPVNSNRFFSIPTAELRL